MMSLHGKTPNATKGARYIGLLDEAVCNARWSDLTELARKVDKHAPDRSCLTLAARTQLHISAASHRPTSAVSAPSSSIHGLGELLPRLVDAIAAAKKTHSDDAYIASICLAEIYWLRETPIEALEILDATPPLTARTASPAATLGWLEVCEVKANYIAAQCLDTSGRQNEAKVAYQTGARRTPGYRTPELRTWTERLLAHACMYCVKNIPSPAPQDYAETYVAFRAWGELWSRIPASAANATTTMRWDIPRRQVWRAYYELLSALLQHRLVRPPHATADVVLVPSKSLPVDQISAARRSQRAEMSRVEAVYETFILAEVKFPKASQTNAEIEAWVEQVMTNWRALADSDWTNSDLGVGGKEAVSRSVLDILYRAATKSFHSTPVLRHLCTVHASLGEFGLAIHAFDSYAEIIDKGKSRAGKTGKHEVGFDDDDTAMLTAVEVVRLLCRFGDRDQAEKAVEIGKTVQNWLEWDELDATPSVQSNGTGNGDQNRGLVQARTSTLRTATLGAAYRAIGISQAHWAQLTYESDTRSSLIAEAKDNLQRAHALDAESIETAHALALVLAETRHVSASLDLIRSTIESAEQPVVTGNIALMATSERQRHLIPLWHLLVVCLTAEDQYEAAAQISTAAFRRLGESLDLFGSASAQSDPEKASADLTTTPGIADRLDSTEKESMIQLKMTQIMLSELMEGPEEATDLTGELSGLYSQLFGPPEHLVAAVTAKPPPTAISHAPSRLGGTLRSIAGSIRPRSARSTFSEKAETTQQTSALENGNVAHDPKAATNGEYLPPVAITVTNEDGIASSEKPQHRHHVPHLPFHHRDINNHNSTAASAQAAAKSSGRPDQPLSEVPHNMQHDHLPAPLGHTEGPPSQDVRLPSTHPTSPSATTETQKPSLYETRHKVSVLVKAWLFSAGLYTRAETYDDAENLIQDAGRLIQSLETQSSKAEPGTCARRLFYKGWGSGQGIDELWAELWCAKAELALACDRPFEAMRSYEQGLSYDPDSSGGIIGISNLLMDIYEEKMPAEEPEPTMQPLPSASQSLVAEARPSLTRPNTSASIPSRRQSMVADTKPKLVDLEDHKLDPSPAELNRLAARDRAYMLLSNLTKQGSGWDSSVAWYTLARAHELSGEMEKAKQALWWVVELENSTPIRPWREVSPGGYTL